MLLVWRLVVPAWQVYYGDPAQQTEWRHEVTRVAEYGIAQEDMAAILTHHGIAIGDLEHADTLALAAQMHMSGQVCAALNRCAQAGDSGSAADKTIP